ncbi:phosphohydrolase [Ruegeria arenilitoris]|uniref:phosphohydrolase n=1 Tax=Ruegeria arenilitoris TaxID=1173585 RepID=UPI00147C0714|nr:phosphohydrolase [Ruegeria arenilitoris]
MTDVIKIIDHSDRVERLFEPYREALGDDYLAYRGHVYRVITFAMHFLDGDEEARPMVETALVYHDIGLWTEHDLAYLEPSEAHALADNEKFGWGLDPQLLKDAIHWHHKVFPYRGLNQRIVEAIRKADWIDATEGKIRKGLTKAQVKAVQDAIPSYGFAEVLQRLAGDLGGNKLSGNLRVLRRVFKW